jgi:hypothetical protein
VSSKLVEVDHGLRGDDRDQALMRDAARHAVEGSRGLEAQRDAHARARAMRVGHAFVADSLDDEQAVEVAAGGGQRLEHRVDAADQVHRFL